MLEVFVVVPNKIYRGRGPIWRSEFHQLRNSPFYPPIKWLINLRSGFMERFDRENSDERLMARAHDMEVLTVASPGLLPPSKKSVDTVLGALRSAELLGEPVYLHCRHGHERTGYVVAAYRQVVQHWDRPQAEAEMDRRGFHNFPFYWWKWSLRRYVSDALRRQVEEAGL